ncbi:MAG: SRPBCC family protein, partial [Streptosporangiales bacterium]|nr:SRPBCC family protein [Streptosporangiales bacterium]
SRHEAPGSSSPMTHVEVTADVRADPDTLWRKIGSFQGVGEWHPLLASVHGEGEGPDAIRTAVGVDGSEQVERLQEVDPTRRLYRYVMESTAMPVRDYRAELRVEPDGDGGSTVRWTSDFEVTGDDHDGTAEVIRGFLDAGLRNIPAVQS